MNFCSLAANGMNWKSYKNWKYEKFEIWIFRRLPPFFPSMFSTHRDWVRIFLGILLNYFSIRAFVEQKKTFKNIIC